MEILLLAPHPFYSERGSSIAVAKLLEVLSQRGDRVDVLTYNEGEDLALDGVAIHRIQDVKWLRGIRPGFSVKKLLADVFMVAKALRMVQRKQYHFVHAVEEAAYIGLAIKALANIPYVYDMDSSLAEQMVEQIPVLKAGGPVLRFFEHIAVRHALAVLPVCPALAREVIKYARGRVRVLHDFSLLGENGHVDLSDISEVNGHGQSVMMYVGNLQRYQGIDLMLHGMAIAARRLPELELVIIGGGSAQVRKYQALADSLGIGQRVHLLGQKPLSHLSAYLDQADIVISPRIKGTATPMKLYSYLDSGKPVIATRLPAHTQVVGPDEALLAEATPQEFGEAMLRLAADRELRERLGRNGKQLVARRFPPSAYRAAVNDIFHWLQMQLSIGPRVGTARATSETS